MELVVYRIKISNILFFFAIECVISGWIDNNTVMNCDKNTFFILNTIAAFCIFRKNVKFKNIW